MSKKPIPRAIRRALEDMEVPERFMPAPPKPKRGRPEIYTTELGDLICLRIAMGESLRQICADEDMPGRWSVNIWKNNKPEFGKKYREARQDQADVYAELGLEEALKSAATPTDVMRARLAFDAYRWAAGKLHPANYGDKVQHSGANDTPLFPIITLKFGIGP